MEIIFLDIDFTILRPEWKLAVIDKEDPSKVLMRIEPSQASLMTTYWKKHNLAVNYNGGTYWLSPEILEKIQKVKKGITLDRIGISMREWTSKEILDRQKNNIEFVMHNLRSLKGKEASVILLSARAAKTNHEEFLKAIKQEITDKLKLSVVKEYFVNDMAVNATSHVTASRKAKIILEHLIGYKIKMNRFVDLSQTQSDKVSFYDDDKLNIDAVDELQPLFEHILRNTDRVLRSKIISMFENKTPSVTTKLATNNDLNPFLSNVVELQIPYNIDLFESYTTKKP
jgi:DNA-binding cell septation regulator SpoVG